MEEAVRDEIEKLCALAEKRGAVAAPIRAGDVVVASWVRFKCRYGCKGYGKHLSCPPYAPGPAETGAMLREYRTGILLRFDGDPAHPTIEPGDIPADFHPWFKEMILWIATTVHYLEKKAFYDGFYRAFGFGAYPCIFCDDCIAETTDGVVDESMRRFCRHMDLMRPSMEASCIDVFATARNVGWDIRPIPCRDMEYGKIEHGDIKSVGLVLVD
ncbi:MAG: metal-binding protein [Methanoculleus sp. SDB]|nr:MAG: metal-binding protein [Methanoculleus sp. SDB]